MESSNLFALWYMEHIVQYKPGHIHEGEIRSKHMTFQRTCDV